MGSVILGTCQTDKGERLWRVTCRGFYRDVSSRSSITVPDVVVTHVLAKGQEEALAKAEPSFAKARIRSEAPCTIRANVIDIESLIPARDASNDKGLGSVPTSSKQLHSIELFGDEDRKRYRLGVCLIPIE
ncbi:MAG: hypothetical protein WC242_03850 [Candidatus Paceibacterota bacterium]|jgi:hypothetical protein